MPLLNLANAENAGFDAIPGGVYDAEVFEVKMDQTKGGEDAKLPAGTELMKVQYRIVGQDGVRGEEFEYFNRRVFNQYVIAPEKVNGKKYEHKGKLDGMLVSFFVAIGYPEEEVKSGTFDPDLNDLKGRECRVSVAKKQKYGSKPEDDEWDNEVKGVKPPADNVPVGGGML